MLLIIHFLLFCPFLCCLSCSTFCYLALTFFLLFTSSSSFLLVIQFLCALSLCLLVLKLHTLLPRCSGSMGSTVCAPGMRSYFSPYSKVGSVGGDHCTTLSPSQGGQGGLMDQSMQARLLGTYSGMPAYGGTVNNLYGNLNYTQVKCLLVLFCSCQKPGYISYRPRCWR